MKAKRRAHALIAALSACALVVVGLLVYNQSRIGKVLDRYRGVPVYDNGLLFFRSYGKNYAPDGYYYGQKWQCVEFIKRFYHLALRLAGYECRIAHEFVISICADRCGSDGPEPRSVQRIH